MVLLRVVTATQAYRAVSWQTVVLVGALIPLSTAISTSGAADQVASLLIDAVGDGRPYLLLVAMFLLTATLGQVVSNTATVLVVVPIAVAAAEATGTSVKPVLMVVAIAGCARAADADRHARQHDDHDARRLPLRRLLEARAAGHGLVVRRRDRRRPPRVGPVTARPAIASTGIDERGTTW